MRSSNQKTFIHPVYVKSGAVGARNQRNVLTHADKQRFYTAKADYQGKTLQDIMNELKEWRGFIEKTVPTSHEE
jgi:hypothetical protein